MLEFDDKRPIDDREYPHDDGPDAEWRDDAWTEDEWNDDSETIPCPSCGAAIYEDAEQCPDCGQYITANTSPWLGRHPLWIILGLLGIIAVIVALAQY